MTCRRSATPARWARRRGGGRLGAAERAGAGRRFAAERAAGDWQGVVAWGWLRAMQDRLDVFGLRARQPFSAPGRLARRLGAKTRPRRVLWLTEEGASFARTAARFGIVPGRVTVLQCCSGRTWRRPAGLPSSSWCAGRSGAGVAPT